MGGILSVSRQMRPLLSMLGWKMGVTNLTLGGSNGYLRRPLHGRASTASRQRQRDSAGRFAHQHRVHRVPVGNSNCEAEETVLVGAAWRPLQLCRGEPATQGRQVVSGAARAQRAQRWRSTHGSTGADAPTWRDVMSPSPGHTTTPAASVDNVGSVCV